MILNHDWSPLILNHHSDVIMGVIASQITSASIVYSAVCSGIDQRKHHSPASLAFVREIHQGPVNSPHKRPVTRKMSPIDYVIMWRGLFQLSAQYRRITINDRQSNYNQLPLQGGSIYHDIAYGTAKIVNQILESQQTPGLLWGFGKTLTV